MVPFLKAARVAGPSVSSALNSLNVMPYTDLRPGWQNGRVGHSGPAPRTSWLPIGARSESLVRLYLAAVALVTANAFWSTAAEGLRATSFSGCSLALSLAVVATASPEASPAPLL